jgi:beta-glucosidase
LDNFNYGGSTAAYGQYYDNSGDGNNGDHGSLFTADGVYGNIAQGWGSGTSWFPYLITPLAAFTARATKENIRVTYSLNNYDLEEASMVAKSADVAFVFVGAR